MKEKVFLIFLRTKKTVIIDPEIESINKLPSGSIVAYHETE